MNQISFLEFKLKRSFSMNTVAQIESLKRIRKTSINALSNVVFLTSMSGFHLVSRTDMAANIPEPMAVKGTLSVEPAA